MTRAGMDPYRRPSDWDFLREWDEPDEDDVAWPPCTTHHGCRCREWAVDMVPRLIAALRSIQMEFNNDNQRPTSAVFKMAAIADRVLAEIANGPALAASPDSEGPSPDE